MVDPLNPRKSAAFLRGDEAAQCFYLALESLTDGTCQGAWLDGSTMRVSCRKYFPDTVPSAEKTRQLPSPLGGLSCAAQNVCASLLIQA